MPTDIRKLLIKQEKNIKVAEKEIKIIGKKKKKDSKTCLEVRPP